MLRFFFKFSTNCTHKTSLNAFSTSTSTNCSEKWDLLSAVCIERKPIIVPPKTAMEEHFHKQLSEVELEKSSKSPHEVRHDNDVKQMELLKKGDSDIDATIKQTAQDFADAALDELNKFEFSSRENEYAADEKSLKRKLDRHLVLLTEQKIANKTFYLLPQSIRNDGESLRQTADRILRESFDKTIKAQIYGNAPAGFYKYRYPRSVRDSSEVVGAKVFIYYARYLNGDVPDTINYKWLDRSELVKELPEKYNKSLMQMLIDE